MSTEESEKFHNAGILRVDMGIQVTESELIKMINFMRNYSAGNNDKNCERQKKRKY